MVGWPKFLSRNKKSETGSAGSGEAKGEPKFQLKQYWNRKWTVVDEFSEKPTDEMLQGQYEPGKYRIDQIDPVTKRFSVLGDTILMKDGEGNVPVSDAGAEGSGDNKGRAGRGGSAVDDLVEQIDGLVSEKEKIDGTLMKVHTLFGGAGGAQQAPPKTLLEQLRDASADAETYAKIFGYSKGMGGKGPFEGVPITGGFPAWAIYGPDILDKFMDRFERRAVTMGLIEGNPQASQDKELQDKVSRTLPSVSFEAIPKVDKEAVDSIQPPPKPPVIPQAGFKSIPSQPQAGKEQAVRKPEDTPLEQREDTKVSVGKAGLDGKGVKTDEFKM